MKAKHLVPALTAVTVFATTVVVLAETQNAYGVKTVTFKSHAVSDCEEDMYDVLATHHRIATMAPTVSCSSLNHLEFQMAQQTAVAEFIATGPVKS